MSCVFVLVAFCAFRSWINEDAIEEGTYTYWTWSKGYLLFSIYFLIDFILHAMAFRSQLFELKPAYKFELVLTSLNVILMVIYML